MGISVRDKTTGQLHAMAGVPVVDSILSNSSRNAIANRAVYNALLGKVEKATNDLVNYWNKENTYSRDEVNALISAVQTLDMEVVASLPSSDISSTTIYLLGPDLNAKYDEYVYINDAWVKIGNTEVDLTNYATIPYVTAAIADFLTETEIEAMFLNYYTKTQVEALIDEVELSVDSELSLESENAVQNKVVTAALQAGKNITFVGTTQQWAAVEDKDEYTLVVLTDA